MGGVRSAAAALLSAAPLLACGPAKIDASSRESTQASIERISREMSPHDRERFQEAIRLLVVDALGKAMEEDFTTTAITQRADARVMAALDGRSADEVIARADALRARDDAGSDEPAPR